MNEWTRDVREAGALAGRGGWFGERRATLYFARVADAVKIGHARDVKARMRLLRVDNAGEVELLGTVAGTLEGERAIHERFAHLRIRGEWFEATDELLHFVTCCALSEERRRAWAEIEADRRAA